MKHSTSEVVQSLFSPNEVIEIVRKGIVNYAAGKYKIPERIHIDRGPSTSLIMPAFGPMYFCTKLISVDPQNHKNDLPIISGILVLNDNTTGEILATFDAPMITALRTAAIGAIGLNIVWSQNDLKLGIIGLGVQGLWQTIFALSTKNIIEVYCYSRSKTKFSSYQTKISKYFQNIKFIYCSSAEQVVEKAQVVMACTTSSRPVFEAEELDIVEKRFISVGSFKKSMQELPGQVYKQADFIIIDSQAAKSEVGDIIQTIKNKWIPEANILTLADVLSGKSTLQADKNMVFKSVGMAAFDLVLAEAAYEKLMATKSK